MEPYSRRFRQLSAPFVTSLRPPHERRLGRRPGFDTPVTRGRERGGVLSSDTVTTGALNRRLAGRVTGDANTATAGQ